MNSKLLKSMVIVLSSLTVLGIVALIIVLNIGEQQKVEGKRSIDEIIETSYETEEITTDLKDNRFVRIQFRIVTDSKDANEELQKRDFQLQNVLIKELASMEVSEFKSGLGQLETTVKLKLNEMMTKGEVTDVYTIKKVLQ
ncbi:flagellar FliL protein [Thalassobacillus cyri]|uniref:Flagellar protein FliL n=1 Tax=Thalassobacillus cyri TaxID=571932 RepID=A0A1H4G0X5_9BACI|nr:flagellar basal body-associated protein FliL [Thalassobacillus cyri]SEB03225.1 flagellar FliL protein [Thalassobacillus cyri]